MKTPPKKSRTVPPSLEEVSFRQWGYLQADLDPLGRLEPFPVPELEALTGPEAERLRRAYCSTIGAEFMHIPDQVRRAWLADRIEGESSPVDTTQLFKRLASVELFEQFLHARYVGTKRFALDGAAALIPLLDSIVATAAEDGVEVVLLGMSHRGRLNVMAHIVGTPVQHIITGFEDVDPRSVFGSGDVKHHLGATGIYSTASGKEVRVHLVSNPSHLEAVNPVLMGRVRARQERIGADGTKKVLAINIHGDAAFAGQGIAAETLNLSELHGYRVGGVIHVIANNLIGFTTEPEQLHSSRFAADVAKRLPIPILHVNGEDPEAVTHCGETAARYRSTFGTDIVIDMIGYRRFGHSEIDDPTTTQPTLYARIKEHPDLNESYGKAVSIDEPTIHEIRAEINARLDDELAQGRAAERRPVIRELPPWWDGFTGGHFNADFDVDSGITPEAIHRLSAAATAYPDDFAIHPKVLRRLEQRREMAAGKRKVDWGFAEALAFGSLLEQGIPVRLTGQDSRRGTFNQRHAVLHDVKSGECHIPLRNLGRDQAIFDIFNSCLSEASVLGFEYGFSRDFPDALVLWEAQFGDFANGAQIIIDQFITAGEDKWDLLSGLVMLLPHGYEGQGPEHSSARFERFLQLAGDDNIQVCQPSTAAQYFHLLRRQALWKWRKPLVVITPKSLLRAEAACSSIEELSVPRFQPVLPDLEVTDPNRVLLCSGKIAHELRAERKRREAWDTAIVAVEQFVPFPKQELRDLLVGYPDAGRVIWVQEEPANMGALFYMRPLLERVARGRRLSSVKRTASASPATGSARAHLLEQKTLLSLAFTKIGS